MPSITGKVTGESAGVNNPFQTIERHDVGVSLKVTPVVMGNGQLVLTIDTRADSISNDDQKEKYHKTGYQNHRNPKPSVKVI
ncbi:hypothetical protein [Paenibacillus tengchongensis]|uniref:hypothetical protein n=1 Tax=Paenibacillus tengchongensis TaxID=2608684 RepID=UPI001FE3F365|nr:hypothetical protein [Paenibacillus tengchongensis]